MPNVGPIEGWRIATVERLPICDRACPRPTVVVVLPSPSGVGVIAETTTYLAMGRPLNSSIASSLIFATSCPYGSRRCGPMPILAATSGIGSKRAWRAICRSVGNSTFITTLSSCESRQHLPAPPLRRLDLVEREHVQSHDAPVWLRELRQQCADEPPRLVATGTKHARQPTRMAAQKARRVGHADLRREAKAARWVGPTRHADVDRKLHAAVPHPLHPSLHRRRVDAHIADDVGRQAALVPHRMAADL